MLIAECKACPGPFKPSPSQCHIETFALNMQKLLCRNSHFLVASLACFFFVSKGSVPHQLNFLCGFHYCLCLLEQCSALGKLLALWLNIFTQKYLQEPGILCSVTQNKDSESVKCLQIPLSSLHSVTFSLGNTVNALLKSLLSLLQFHMKIKRFVRTLQVTTAVASNCPASQSSKCLQPV